MLSSFACTSNEDKQKEPSAVTLNKKDNGYRGIWYMNDEYVYKYSGGLGTYCAKHRPFTVYSDKAKKTFFCYGGTSIDSNKKLLNIVSYYDHKTKMVPRPTILLDKKTTPNIRGGFFVYCIISVHN